MTYIFWFLVGAFLGALGMALCRSGAQEDANREIYYLKSVLREVLDWSEAKGNIVIYRTDLFPKKEIQEALKEE